MTDHERELIVARLEGIAAGLDLAIRMAHIHQHQLARSRLARIQRPRPKRDAFDKFTDFITLKWLI